MSTYADLHSYVAAEAEAMAFALRSELELARREAGMSIAELARRAGTSPATARRALPRDPASPRPQRQGIVLTSELLENLRVQQNLTITDLARLSCLSPSTVRRVLSGADARLRSLCQVCIALGVTLQITGHPGPAR